MSVRDDLTAALADLKAALAEENAEIAPYQSFIPANVMSRVDAIRRQQQDAIDQITAALGAMGDSG